MSRSVVGVAVAVAALGAAIIAAPALAAGSSKTTLKISGGFTDPDNHTVIEGTVSSPKASCTKGRTVVVTLPKQDGGDGQFSKVIAKSDSRGEWSVILPTSGGLYGTYKAKTASKHAGKTLCKADSAPPFVFEH